MSGCEAQSASTRSIDAMLAFISPSVACVSETSAPVVSMNSWMPPLDQLSSERPLAISLSMAFICALSSGRSTSSIVVTIALYRDVICASLPICTRKTSCLSKSCSAGSGVRSPR